MNTFKVSFLFVFAFSISLSAKTKKPLPKRSPIVISEYSLFGDKYAATPIVDHQLKDHVYYIVSGHGGPDPGAQATVNGLAISEDEYAYDVSLRLAKNLISHDALVYMIVRDENDGIRDQELLEMDHDETVWGGEKIPLSQAERLKQRTRIINQLFKENNQKGYKTQRVIETHVDSRYTERKVDIFFYYNENKPESQELAENMFQTIKKKYDAKQKGRGYTGEVKPRNLWMITQSKPPIVFIELGNITNEFDRKRLLLSDNRQAIANWLTDGLLTFE
ncbi:MAG: N-acetylmuramoyl-L-alanine amidase family protein [Leadbetterella sp.]